MRSRLQPGQQLLSAVRLDDLWLTANFKESPLKQMRAGLPALIHVDAFNRDYDDYVQSLPAAGGATFGALQPREQRETSGKWCRVAGEAAPQAGSGSGPRLADRHVATH